MDRLVECELVRIYINDNSEQQYIFLGERNGNRQFAIVIARAEAEAIDRFVRGEDTMRPLTHTLFATTLQAIGARVECVEIPKLVDGTFFGTLVITANGESVRIDARPSDSIALSVCAGAPIFVHEDVLSEVAVTE